MTMAYTDVLFEEMQGQDGNLGIMTLNRPGVLNSLDHGMIHAMHQQLKTWATSPTIKAVIIRAAEGRAFCAGGDLKYTYDCIKAHDPAIKKFFHDEYQLNQFIFHFPKPYIALLDGITMGGGVGVSIHGSHRVATDQLLFAMPETGIGFFPDVGGTYFLPRLPYNIGMYLGLTGARMKSDDCVHFGIATHKVARDSLPELITALADKPFTLNNANKTVSQVIEQYQLPISSSFSQDHQTLMEACFSENTVEEILHALQCANHHWAKETAENLVKKSPTSLKVTLEALRHGKQLDFDACMRQEFRLVTRFLESHDFAEGIRSVIIDKDQTPHWQPSSLEAVTATDMQAYFASLAKEL